MALAMSSTTSAATLIILISSGVPVSAMPSVNDSTVIDTSAFSFGNCRTRSRPIESISAAACARETPERSRPAIVYERSLRAAIAFGVIATGAQTSERSGKSKPRGATPITS